MDPAVPKLEEHREVGAHLGTRGEGPERRREHARPTRLHRHALTGLDAAQEFERLPLEELAALFGPPEHGSEIAFLAGGIEAVRQFDLPGVLGEEAGERRAALSLGKRAQVSLNGLQKPHALRVTPPVPSCHNGNVEKKGFMRNAQSLLSLAIASTLLTLPALADPKLPKPVQDAFQTRFPSAVISKVTKEKKKVLVVYDIEFRQGGRKLEADFAADGRIQSWEQEVAAGDLPAAVRASVDQRYPQPALKEAMKIIAVTAGRESLEGYELVLKPQGRREVEMTLTPDGKIVEDSGAKKK